MVRIAQKIDENNILAMLDSTEKRHFHADWRMPTAWIGEPCCVVYEQDVRPDGIRGYMAATLDPAPVAWIRVLAVKKHDPVPAVQQMVDLAAEHLTGTADTIACLTVCEWVDKTLPKVGFTAERKMQTWVKHGWELPSSQQSRSSQSPNITIRPVQPNDYPTLITVERRAFPEPLWWHSEEQLRLGKKFSCCFDVAEMDGRIVGFQYSAGQKQQYVHLVRVAVDPTFQGHGIGHALMVQAIKTYAEMGVENVSLNTQVGNESAAKLYRKFGFSPAGREFNVWEYPLK